MTTKTEKGYPGEGIFSEANGNRSRESVIVADGQTLKANQIVATVANKVVALNPVAVDGSEAATGMLFADVTASGADARGVAIVRDAELQEDAIVWPDGITDPQKAVAITELEALGLIIR